MPDAGKIALITGVSRHNGIGAATAHAFAQAGIDVFTTHFHAYDQFTLLSDNPGEPLLILDTVRAKGIRADGIEADLTDPTVPARVFDHIEATFGKVDILVNNATHDELFDIYGLSAEALDKHYAVIVRGATLLSKEFATRHDGRPGGRIINLTSGQGLTPMPDNIAYAICKGAVEALTISLAAGLAAKGITVNALDPGPTDTGWMDDELRTRLIRQAPMGRLGTPQDAAHMIAFLASDEAQWITGQIIRSRGGF